MQYLQKNDRVELVSLGCNGIVEAANDQFVRVRWDDGKVGLLYYEDGMIPNARHLQCLPTPRTDKAV